MNTPTPRSAPRTALHRSAVRPALLATLLPLALACSPVRDTSHDACPPEPPALATGNLDIVTDAMVRAVTMDDNGKATGEISAQSLAAAMACMPT